MCYRGPGPALNTSEVPTTIHQTMSALPNRHNQPGHALLPGPQPFLVYISLHPTSTYTWPTGRTTRQIGIYHPRPPNANPLRLVRAITVQFFHPINIQHAAHAIRLSNADTMPQGVSYQSNPNCPSEITGSWYLASQYIPID